MKMYSGFSHENVVRSFIPFFVMFNKHDPLDEVLSLKDHKKMIHKVSEVKSFDDKKTLFYVNFVFYPFKWKGSNFSFFFVEK